MQSIFHMAWNLILQVLKTNLNALPDTRLKDETGEAVVKIFIRAEFKNKYST
jgi:hypothetical protein